MAELTHAQAIALVRRGRGMTQAELAAAAGVRRETVARVESAGIDDGRAVWDLVAALGGDVLAEAQEIIREERTAVARERRASQRAARCDVCGRPLARPGRGRPRKRHSRCAR